MDPFITYFQLPIVTSRPYGVVSLSRNIGGKGVVNPAVPRDFRNLKHCVAFLAVPVRGLARYFIPLCGDVV